MDHSPLTGTGRKQEKHGSCREMGQVKWVQVVPFGPVEGVPSYAEGSRQGSAILCPRVRVLMLPFQTSAGQYSIDMSSFNFKGMDPACLQDEIFLVFTFID